VKFLYYGHRTEEILLNSLVSKQIKQMKSLGKRSYQTQKNNRHFNIANVRYLLTGNIVTQKKSTYL